MCSAPVLRVAEPVLIESEVLPQDDLEICYGAATNGEASTRGDARYKLCGARERRRDPSTGSG